MNTGRALTAIVLASFWLFGVAETSAEGPMVRVEDGLLWVQVEETPLRNVLSAIAEESGVAIEGVDGLSRIVSVEFSGVAVEEGIRRLLQGLNFVFEYQGERLARVYVSGGGAVPKMSEAGRVSAGDEEWLRQLIEFLDAYSSPSAALLLQQARQDPNSASLLIRALDWLPSMGEKGRTLLGEALKSKDPAIRARASELLEKKGGEVRR